MRVTEETKRVAQDALDYIVEHPERHDQSVWFDYNTDQSQESNGHPRLYKKGDANLCDTTMCVGGTVQWQQKGYIDIMTVDVVAAELLGLTEDEATTLFFETDDAQAVDMLTAIANGDAKKFASLAADVH